MRRNNMMEKVRVEGAKINKDDLLHIVREMIYDHKTKITDRLEACQHSSQNTQSTKEKIARDLLIRFHNRVNIKGLLTFEDVLETLEGELKEE
jgi:predicted ThiF/HesA family dinucleotide-utilizing enzyme